MIRSNQLSSSSQYLIKMTRVGVLGLLFSFVCSVDARIGETMNGIEDRYGKPLPQSVDYSQTKEIQAASYEFNGFEVRVFFRKGKSVQEIFKKKTPLSASDIEGVLQDNSDNRKWTVVEPEGDSWQRHLSGEPPRPVPFCSPPIPLKKWERWHGVTASLLTYSLTITTTQRSGF